MDDPFYIGAYASLLFVLFLEEGPLRVPCTGAGCFVLCDGVIDFIQDGRAGSARVLSPADSFPAQHPVWLEVWCVCIGWWW